MWKQSTLGLNPWRGPARTGDVPEVCEQLLDLRLELVDVPPPTRQRTAPGTVRRRQEDREMEVIDPRSLRLDLPHLHRRLRPAGRRGGAARLSLRAARGRCYALFSLIVFAGFAVSAWSLRERGERIAAGVFAFIAVNLFGAFVVALYTWFGWLSLSSGPFSGFSLARLTFVALHPRRRARGAAHLPVPAADADRGRAVLVLRHRSDLGRRRLVGGRHVLHRARGSSAGRSRSTEARTGRTGCGCTSRPG